VQTDQELFAKGLATYQKVVRHNYMAHKEVYDLLNRLLLTEAPDGFVFLDIACGDATASARALGDTKIGRYIGIDISQPSLDAAKVALSKLHCQVDLRRQDFVEAINAWNEPVDVIWVGQSVHHLRLPEKREFMKRVRASLPSNAFFLIWEATCLDGEDREEWMARFRQQRSEWSALTDEEFASFDSHHRASDYSETAATWMGLGRDAGFKRVEQLFIVPNQLARVYRYGH
jgi:cyclopropane fatty-acyl-phospholipid synthase-like methyltransferase